MTLNRFTQGVMPWERTPNVILNKAELGKSKPITHNLPHDNYAYGDRVPYGPEDSNQVMYNLTEHQPTRRQSAGADFRKTNKACITQNLHTSSQFYNFRKTNTSLKNTRLGSKEIPLYLPYEGFTYGKPGDLQDPIKSVIANGYGQHDAVMRHSFYAGQTKNRSSQPQRLSCHITKNHYLLREATKQKLKKLEWNRPLPEFKLTKFQGVPHKVDHTRSKAMSWAAGRNEANQASNPQAA